LEAALIENQLMLLLTHMLELTVIQRNHQLKRLHQLWLNFKKMQKNHGTKILLEAALIENQLMLLLTHMLELTVIQRNHQLKRLHQLWLNFKKMQKNHGTKILLEAALIENLLMLLLTHMLELTVIQRNHQLKRLHQLCERVKTYEGLPRITKLCNFKLKIDGNERRKTVKDSRVYRLNIFKSIKSFIYYI
jgi:hypothetical protein